MTEETYQRKLTAILSADVAGYSLLMRNDEAATVRTITTYRKALTQLTQQYRGRVVDSPGDNILAEFTSVVDAVNCAVEIQRELAERNAELSEDRRMRFRIGINLGDVIAEGKRIYGDGVNIAARMEGLSDVGGICISGTVYDAIESKLGLEYEFLGEQEVKNIEKPVRTYRVLSYPGAAAHRVVKAKAAVGRKWRKITMAVVAVLFLFAAGFVLWNSYLAPPVIEKASIEKMAFPLPEKPSIAVLPFVNMSDDKQQEYFSDGITEDIITDLSANPNLFVIARNSTFAYKGKTIKIQLIARELGVKFVLEGSVRKAGNKVRINAQLIDAISGHHLWAERYDGQMIDVFALQDKISEKIVAALNVKISVGEKKGLDAKETGNINAYDAFLKGWDYLHRETSDDLVLAISSFELAVELDPAYSRAQAALAWAYLSSSLRWKWREFVYWHNHLRLMARKHLSLAMRNPNSTAHLVASKMAMFRRQYEDAETHAQHALSLDNNDPDTNLNMAWVLINTGKPVKMVLNLSTKQCNSILAT